MSTIDISPLRNYLPSPQCHRASSHQYTFDVILSFSIDLRSHDTYTCLSPTPARLSNTLSYPSPPQSPTSPLSPLYPYPLCRNNRSNLLSHPIAIPRHRRSDASSQPSHNFPSRCRQVNPHGKAPSLWRRHSTSRLRSRPSRATRRRLRQHGPGARTWHQYNIRRNDI